MRLRVIAGLLTFRLPLLRGNENGPFSVLNLNIWSHHPEPLFQDLIETYKNILSTAIQ